MSTHNIYFYGELTKTILQLSSNTLPICFSVWKSLTFTVQIPVSDTLTKNRYCTLEGFENLNYPALEATHISERAIEILQS